MLSITVVVLSSFVACASSTYSRVVPQWAIPPGFYVTFTNSTNSTGYGVVIQKNYGRYMVSCRSCLYCCTQRYQAITSTKTTTTLSLKTSNDTTNSPSHPPSFQQPCSTGNPCSPSSPCSPISALSINDSSVMSASEKPCGILGTEHSISTVTPNITNLNEISIFPTPCVNVTAGNSQSSYKPCNVSETEHSKSITTLGISQSKEMGILPNASKTPSVNTVLPNKPCGILGNEHIITTDVPVISKLNEVEIFSTPNIQKEINQSCTVFIHAIEVNISCNCQKADDKLECPCKQAETGENHIPCSAVNRTIIIRNGRFNGNGGPISCAKAVQLGIISEVDIPKSCTTSYMTGALKGNGENNHISSDELVIPTGQSVTLIVDDTSVYTVESSSVAFSIFSTLPFIIITSLLIPQ